MGAVLQELVVLALPQLLLEEAYLDNYSWDTVELELSYSSVAEYPEPVRVSLAAER